MESTHNLASLSTRDVIWEKCWERTLKISVPLDGSKNFTAKACVRFLVESGTFYAEVQVEGNVARYPLATASYEYRYGIASVKLTITDVDISGTNLKSVTFKVELCVGASYGGINLEKCWKVYEDTVRFFANNYSADGFINSNPYPYIHDGE
jgi:hypothetical protein